MRESNQEFMARINAANLLHQAKLQKKSQAPAPGGWNPGEPRAIWRSRMRSPVVGSRPYGRKRGGRPANPCSCCMRNSCSSGQLCTVCHKFNPAEKCCGYYAVHVSWTIRVPRIGSGRWKAFLKRFPYLAFDEGRKVIVCGVCGDDYALKNKEHHFKNHEKQVNH